MTPELTVLALTAAVVVLAVSALVRAACGWIVDESPTWPRALLTGIVLVGAPAAGWFALGWQAALGALALAVLAAGPVLGVGLLTGAGVGLLGTLTACAVGVICVLGLSLAGVHLNVPLPGFMGSPASSADTTPADAQLSALTAAADALCACSGAEGSDGAQLTACTDRAAAQVGRLKAELASAPLGTETMGRFLAATSRAAGCETDARTAIAALDREPAAVAGVQPQPADAPTTEPADAAPVQTARPVQRGSASVAAALPGPLIATPVSRDLSVPYSYRSVPIGALDQHLGKLVRIQLNDGTRRTDQLVALTEDMLELRRSRAAGGDAYSLAREEIADTQVFDRWPP